MRAAPLPLSPAVSWSADRVQHRNVSTHPQFGLTQLHAASAITAQLILVSEDAETWRG